MTEPNPLAVGVDIGGSKTAIGLVDTKLGTIIEQRVLDTPRREDTGLSFAQAIAAEAEKILSPSSSESLSRLRVGIGICELVEPSGKIVSSHRVVMRESDLSESLADFAKLVIESDVRAAAVAEARFGAGRNLAHWIYVNAGTGIASVVMNQGSCHLGAHGWAVGLGMGRANLSSRDGMLVEDMAGGAGLLNVAKHRGLDARSVRELLAMARSGCQTARSLMEEGGHVLGRAIANLVNVLDPETVVIGGGLTSTASYWNGLLMGTAEDIWHFQAKDTQIVRAELQQYAGLIGAAVAAGPDLPPKG